MEEPEAKEIRGTWVVKGLVLAMLTYIGMNVTPMMGTLLLLHFSCHFSMCGLWNFYNFYIGCWKPRTSSDRLDYLNYSVLLESGCRYTQKFTAIIAGQLSEAVRKSILTRKTLACCKSSR